MKKLLALCFIGCSLLHLHAAIARVQFKHVYVATSGVGVAFDSNNTLHNFIIVWASGHDGGVAVTCSISDSQGNTYNPLTPQDNPFNAVSTCGWYATDIKAGPNTVAVTWSAGDLGWTAIEYSGVALTGALDVQAQAAGCNGAQCTPPAINSCNCTTIATGYFTTTATDLISAYFADEGTNTTVTAGTNYTLVEADSGHWDGAEEWLNAAAQTTIAAFNPTSSGKSWIINAAAFKAAGGSIPVRHRVTSSGSE